MILLACERRGGKGRERGRGGKERKGRKGRVERREMKGRNEGTKRKGSGAQSVLASSAVSTCK
jgi:hypothetical protein